MQIKTSKFLSCPPAWAMPPASALFHPDEGRLEELSTILTMERNGKQVQFSMRKSTVWTLIFPAGRMQTM